MAIELATGYVSIVPSTKGFGRQLSGQIGPQVSSVGRSAGGSFMGGFKTIAAGAAIAAGVAIGAAVTKGVASGIDYNAVMEQNRIGFETMLGSAGKADKMLGDLQKFAAKTPFEFPELAEASKRMLAMGFSAEDIMPTLTSVGDAASGLGVGSEGMNSIIRALGQMQAKGKVSAEEMLQLTEVGIPAWKILADAMGVSTAEAMKLSEKGLIPADKAVSNLVTGMEKRFPNMMAKQSQSFSGLMSTLRDNVNMTLGQVMEPAFNRIKTLLPPIIAAVGDFSAKFASGGLGSAIASMFPPSLVAMVTQFIDILRSMTPDTASLRSGFAQVQSAGQKLWQVLGPAFRQLQAVYLEVLRDIAPSVKAMLAEVMPTLAALLTAFRKTWTAIAPVVMPVMKFIYRFVGATLRGLIGFIRVLMATLRGDWKGAWEIIKSTAKAVWADIGRAAAAAGRGLLQAFIDGVKQKVATLKGVITGIVQWIRDRLPGSDAKYGPLSDLTKSGRALPQTFAKGIVAGQGAVQSAALGVAAMAAPNVVDGSRYSSAAAPVPAVAGAQFVINGSRYDADFIRREVELALVNRLGG